jgi:signal transduction histidine kinase
VQRELAVARLQSEFVSAVSHEFRTPVTSLRHVVELLQEDDEVNLDRRRAFYDVLSRNTDRLHRLVESLLDFSRMEHGRKVYDLQPLDACALVSTIVEDFRTDSASRDRAVSLTIPQQGSFFVRADTAALGHALWNLLDNAVKYSPGGGHVAVTVESHPRGVAIVVSDQGIGVPSAEREEILRKFVRGQNASRLGIKGTGMGLAIVMHIVKAHAGRLELESQEGRGSLFRILLPSA